MLLWRKKNGVRPEESRRFYRQITAMVIPIVVQNLLSAAVNSADVVMLNYVGQSSISAVSLAAQYSSVLFMVYYGLGTGATMLCAQYYGKGDFKAIRAVEGIAMRFSLLISAGFAGAALLCPQQGDQAGLPVSVPSEQTAVFGFRAAFASRHGERCDLGSIIGENKMEEARRDASRLMKLTVASGALGGLIVLAAAPLVLRYADLTEQAMHYLKYMLLINTYYVMGAAVNTTLIAGVFRAGGDRRFGFFCDTATMWGYAVPLGFLLAFALKRPVLGVYFLMCTDEFVKWPWVLKHYRSGKWLKNIMREDLFEEQEQENENAV